MVLPAVCTLSAGLVTVPVEMRPNSRPFPFYPVEKSPRRQMKCSKKDILYSVLATYWLQPRQHRSTETQRRTVERSRQIWKLPGQIGVKSEAEPGLVSETKGTGASCAESKLVFLSDTITAGFPVAVDTCFSQHAQPYKVDLKGSWRKGATRKVILERQLGRI